MKQTSLFVHAVNHVRICAFDLHLIFTKRSESCRNRLPGMNLFQSHENFLYSRAVSLLMSFIRGIIRWPLHFLEFKQRRCL